MTDQERIGRFISEIGRVFYAPHKEKCKMAFEQRDNSGSLWVNDRKSEENHPDRSGTVMIEGKLYFCNGWLRKTRDGKPYLSLSFKPKDTPADKSKSHDPDDEIPF